MHVLYSNDPRRLADWYAGCFGIVPAGAAEGDADCNAIYRTFEVRDASIDTTADYPYGHFAWLKDCDGNAVELWEPR